jgi:hypothetical protein
MVILAGDNDWESRLITAFKRRIEFELTGIDKLKLSEAELHKLIVDWSVRWTYTPRFTHETTIRFQPDMFPPAPPPDQRCGQRL